MELYTEQAEQPTLSEWLSNWGAGPLTIEMVADADSTGLRLSDRDEDLEGAIKVLEIALSIPKDWDWTK